jgi:cyclin-dependent kinase regulatory subunit CKS1
MSGELDIDFTRRNKKPRPLSEHEKEKLDEFVDAIHYSARCVVYWKGQRVHTAY